MKMEIQKETRSYEKTTLQADKPQMKWIQTLDVNFDLVRKREKL